MLILSKSDVARAVSMDQVITAVRSAVLSYTSGEADIPVRTPIETPNGVSLFMPGLLRDTGAMGVKMISIFPDNASRGVPTIAAALILNDVTTGAPVALMEAGHITAMRTGAASAVATSYLAREDSSTLAVFGAGPQARTQVEAMMCVRPFRRVLVCDLRRDLASAFAAEVARRHRVNAVADSDTRAIVRAADVICTATTSTKPVFDGRDVQPGTHVNGIGSYTPTMRELDEHLVARADRFVTDTREGAWKEAGDLLTPLSMGVIKHDRIDAELGDLVLGRSPGRAHKREITVYKGVGLAAMDLATARIVYEFALEQKIGTNVELTS